MYSRRIEDERALITVFSLGCCEGVRVGIR